MLPQGLVLVSLNWLDPRTPAHSVRETACFSLLCIDDLLYNLLLDKNPALLGKNGELAINCRINNSFEPDNYTFKFSGSLPLTECWFILLKTVSECGLLST